MANGGFDVAESVVKTLARPYEELIVPLECRVQTVLAYHDPTEIATGELRIGEIRRGERGGYQTDLEIIVLPEDEKSIVRRLTFSGNSPIRKGDLIRAHIFRGREVNQFGGHPANCGILPGRLLLNEPKERTYFIPRNWGIDEDALYIEIIDEEKKVVRTDYGVKYKARK